MLNKSFLRPLLTFTRDFVAAQTLESINRLLGSADIGFDVALGLGVATNTSIIAGFSIGGFNDQQAVAVCRYTSATAVGSEDFGIILRTQTIHSPNATYYYFRVDSQQCKITKVVDGTFTTLAQAAFTLPQNTDVTITCSVVGETLTANFLAGALNVDLASVDSSIPTGGLVGFRTQNSTGYIKSLVVSELAL